jgi:basic amino acid/polyamine antiporter, APA family
MALPSSHSPFSYKRLFATKSTDMPSEGSGLKRVLGVFDLIMFGIGAIIGTGIFVMTGQAAAGSIDRPGAGPAIVLSFVVTAVACGFAALCYAEFASMIPVSGSAYTYAYASFGELMAWIIGWDLILEYAVGNVAIAIGWSGYLVNVLEHVNIHLPPWLSIGPMTFYSVLSDIKSGDPALLKNIDPNLISLVNVVDDTAPRIGQWPVCINAAAAFIVALVTGLLYFGIKESARLNSVLVILKFVMIGLFLYYAVPHVNIDKHWTPFMPNGWTGVMTGASIIFFAYIGFDSISTAAEEAKDPQRTLPIAIIGSLAICTVLYVLVSAALTGMVPLSVLNNEAPVAEALKSVGAPGVASIISLGAVVSMASVLLVMQLGQTRIFFAMSRDGLIPKAMSKVHPRFGTPYASTLVTGFFVAIPASLIDIRIAADVCSIGTLFAFVLVALGILILRVRSPETHRGFRVPAVWLCAPLCIATCGYLMFYLGTVNWIRFGIWMALGLGIYFLYGIRHSRIGQEVKPASE